MSGGKSKNQTSTQQSTSTTDLPSWVTGPAQSALQTATQLSQRPYDAYTGQQVADVPQDTQAAYQAIRDMQGDTSGAFAQSTDAYGRLIGQANPLTAGGVNDTTNQLYGNYQQQVLNPAQGLLGGYLSGGPATADQVTQNALNIMNPFSKAVIDPALEVGRQQLAQNLGAIGAQANQAGAFGGSRQGVLEGTAQAQAAIGAGQMTGNLLNQGWQSALTPAYGLANLASQQGYGAAGTLAGMGQAGYNAAAQQGQGIANTNLQAGLTAAQQLPQTAVAQAGEKQKEASLMQTIGAAQQAQQQSQLNAQQGQFYEKQNWPVQNLDILLSSLGGVPYGSTTSSYGTSTGPGQSKNMASGVLGGAASGAAIGSMFPGIGTAIGAIGGGILGAL